VNPARLENVAHNIGTEWTGRDPFSETAHNLSVPGRADSKTPQRFPAARGNLSSRHPPSDAAGSVSPLPWINDRTRTFAEATHISGVTGRETRSRVTGPTVNALTRPC